MEYINPLELERNIKNIFNKNFKIIAGNKYFEGNEKIMLKLFIEIKMIVVHYLIIYKTNIQIIHDFPPKRHLKKKLFFCEKFKSHCLNQKIYLHHNIHYF